MKLELNVGVQFYDFNMLLFMDYVYKLCMIWMLGGVLVVYVEKEIFDFFVGIVIIKIFYYFKFDGLLLQIVDMVYDLQQGCVFDLSCVWLVEMWLFVCCKDGWVVLFYVWNVEQIEVMFFCIGDDIVMMLKDDEGSLYVFIYVVLNQNQCVSCYVVKIKGKDLQLIGLKVCYLNCLFVYVDGMIENQLEYLVKIGYLSGLFVVDVLCNVDWKDVKQLLEVCVCVYLDINCVYCYNFVGVVNNIGLNFEFFLLMGCQQGVCKLLVVVGKGMGDCGFGIVFGQFDQFIMIFCLVLIEGGIMMFEFGCSMVYQEGLKLICEWIKVMFGVCEVVGLQNSKF